MKANLNNRGLLIGFTKWQTTTAYPMFKKFFKNFGVELDFQKIDEYALCVNSTKTNFDINRYDFLIQLVKDQYISSIFEENNKPCFNKYCSMALSDDKFLTYIKLFKHDIPLPKTLSGNTDFDGLKIDDYKRSKIFIGNVEKELSYPFVAKPTFGYGGRGVKTIKNQDELKQLLETQGQNAYMFQEYINENVGNNIRLVLVGKKVIYSVLRIDTVNLQKNTIGKDDEVSYTPTKEQKYIAEKIAEILDLDYCAVDFFDTLDKRPLVCEVNANPGGIEEYEKITGVNQAEKLVYYILKNVYKK